jgi:phage I-like protein
MPRIVPLSSFALPDSEGPPSEFLLLPMGEFRSTHGVFVVDALSVQSIMQRQAEYGNDLVIDYEHQSLNTLDNGAPAPAAGWISRLDARQDGIWVAGVTWTERAMAHLSSREYRYFSPVLALADTGDGRQRVVAVLNVALTNSPATLAQTPLINSNRGENMENEVVPQIPTPLHREIITLTGAATADAALGVVSGWRDAHAQVAVLSARVRELEEATANRERNAILDRAEAEGYLSTAQRPLYASQSVEWLTAWARTANPLLPPRAQQPNGEPTVVTLSQAVNETDSKLPYSERILQARAKYPHLRGN